MTEGTHELAATTPEEVAAAPAVPQLAASPIAQRFALLQAAGNRRLARLLAPERMVQRVGGWSGTGVAAANQSEQTASDVRRIPVEGLSTVSRALVLVPKQLDPAKPIDVIVHLHGQNTGYVTATPRDLDPAADRIEEQMKAAGRAQLVAVLPQGTSSGADYNEFQKLKPKDYAKDALKKVGELDVAAKTPRGLPAEPTLAGVVLSGHSGGGFAMKTILDSAAEKDLAGVVWFDAVQAESGPKDDRKSTGQRETAKKIINQRIAAELKAVPDGASATAVTAALSTGFTFRLYYNASGWYAGAAGEVETHLRALFGEGPKAPAAQKALAAQIAALDPAARAALRARYQTIGVTQTQNPQHDINIGLGKLDTTGHDNMVGSNAFADAIRALPAVSAASPSAPPPMPTPKPPTPAPKSTSLDSEPDLVPENALVVASVDRRMLSRVEDVALRLISETVALGRADGAGPSAGHSLLRQDDIRAALVARSGDLGRGFDLGASVITSIPEGQRDSEYRAQAEGLIMMLENLFIHDSSRSTIDLLSPERAKHFRDMKWHRLDYPGHAPGEAAGPHEGEAAAMAAELAVLRPERRPNRGGDAVILESELTAAKRRRLVANVKAVPGQTGARLFGEAADAFERMARVAGFDGIALTILSSWRDPTVAAANAQASGNAMAVAAFSSHSLGLAIDIAMSGGGQHFEEMTTRPMSNVAGMRSAEAHKWMVLRAEKFGWYPYGNEPWHWEYNPPGFRDRFRQALEPVPAAAPAPAP